MGDMNRFKAYLKQQKAERLKRYAGNVSDADFSLDRRDRAWEFYQRMWCECNPDPNTHMPDNLYTEFLKWWDEKLSSEVDYS